VTIAVKLALLCVGATLAVAANGNEPSATKPEFDVLIRNGTVVDGTGALPVRADVGIRDGLITFVGAAGKRDAQRVIDATRLIVAPGFIDVHSHADGVMPDQGPAAERVSLATASQGVTTAVLGPDGFYSAARIAQRKATFETFGIGVNYAFYVGHNGVRREVMKDGRSRATPEQVRLMGEQVRRGMELGAVGLSTGLMYDPGMFSDTDEVVELARAVAPFGGIYDSHVRDPVFQLLDSDREALLIGERAGIGAKIAHEKAPGLMNHGRAVDIVELVNAERSQGRDAVVDQYPYDGASTGLLKDLFILPDVARAAGGTPIATVRARLADKTQLPLIRKATENGIDGGFSWLKAVGYGGLRVVASAQAPQLVGRNLELLARERKVDGFDLVVDLVNRFDDLRVTMADINEADIRLLMVQSWTMIASDGNGIDAARTPAVCKHPRSLGTFPRVLGHYARDEGVLSLPDAVRKMTSLPASYLHLADRGRIAIGLAADITVFDPLRVADRATYEKPCELSTGIQFVLVNGISVFEDGRTTGALPGRFVARQSP